MSHQSDWSYYKQLIKLLLIKVNPVCGYFIDPDFRTAIFVFIQTETRYSSDVSDASVYYG